MLRGAERKLEGRYGDPAAASRDGENASSSEGSRIFSYFSGGSEEVQDSACHLRSISCRWPLLRLLASAVGPSRLPKVVINGTLVALPLNLSYYMSLVVDKFLEGGGRGSEGRMKAE